MRETTLIDLTRLIPAEPPRYEGRCGWKQRANARRLAEWEASCQNIPKAPDVVRDPAKVAQVATAFRDSARYRGVRWLVAAGMWEAWYSIGPYKTIVGRFADETEAAKARDRAILAVGCTAARNFDEGEL